MKRISSTESAQNYVIAKLIDLGVEQEAIDIGLGFDEMDIDSLDIADLITSIKEECGIEIPRHDLIGITLTGFIERIADEASSATSNR
jgi:acyl carrier protein